MSATSTGVRGEVAAVELVGFGGPSFGVATPGGGPARTATTTADTAITPRRASAIAQGITLLRWGSWSGTSAMGPRGNVPMKLYYALPHTHTLGTRFFLEAVGGPKDGELVLLANKCLDCALLGEMQPGRRRV